MSRRQNGWALAIFAGACGWYLTFAIFKVVPPAEPWVVKCLLQFGALLAWACSLPVVCQDMEMITKRLAATEHYTPIGKLKDRKKRLTKWLMVLFFIWWLPLLFMFGEGINNE